MDQNAAAVIFNRCICGLSFTVGDDLSVTERVLRRFRIRQQHLVRVAQQGASSLTDFEALIHTPRFHRRV